MRQLRTSQRPFVITKNGSPSAVLLVPEVYDELAEDKKFINTVRQGLADDKSGKFIVDDE